MATIVTADQIRSEVKRFWDVFSSKKANELAAFYAPEASVFGSLSSRPEPGRLAAARREREYFHPACNLRASTGAVEVHMAGDSGGVASYIFEFHATQVGANGGGKSGAEESIRNGRATQVFALDPDGNLRIVHEHFSLPTKL
jgi:ketosteroid isomerase-like protein